MYFSSHFMEVSVRNQLGPRQDGTEGACRGQLLQQDGQEAQRVKGGIKVGDEPLQVMVPVTYLLLLGSTSLRHV